MGMNEQITAAALLHPLAELTDFGRGRQRPCVFVRANAPMFYSRWRLLSSRRQP